MDGELADQLVASGDYTEDQVMSMIVWQAFAGDMKDSPELKGCGTRRRSHTDIDANYGFTISQHTATVLMRVLLAAEASVSQPHSSPDARLLGGLVRCL